MVDPALVRRRLVAQGLVTRPFATAHDAVAAFGAMQGQDLAGVMASIALRLRRVSPEPGAAIPEGIDRVIVGFDDGTVVRGYPMRGTVFAVAAEDLRWMTELCAGGPTRAQVRRRGQLGLDEEQIARFRALLEETVGQAPRGIARRALFDVWERAGLAPAGGRGYHVLSFLIATGVAAYGPWNGTDNDVVLAATWLPPGTSIAERFGGDQDAATADLLLRYLGSHGPATLRDAAWWTKLPLGGLRRALPLVTEHLEHAPGPTGEELWWRPGLDQESVAAGAAVDALHLLPGFDEIVLGYPDRLALVAPEHHAALAPGNNGIFQRAILRRGRIVGTWRRSGRPGRRALELTGFEPLPQVARHEAERAHRTFPHLAE